MNPALAGVELAAIVGDLTLSEAQVLCACLEAESIPADIPDARLALTGQALSSLTGGVRVLVRARDMQRARSVFEAYRRGDYALGEDVDVGEPQP